jgi:capsular polysaccharide biosynthesis protein
MDTIDRSHSNLPAQFSTQLAPLPPMTPALPFEQAGAPSINFGPKVIVRGITRHWKLILPVWVVLSAIAMVVIKSRDTPTYDASSLIEIEPVQDDIFGPIARKTNEDSNRSVTFLQTQVHLITSNSILEPALVDPTVVDLPTVKKWEDPRYDLRRKLRVYPLGDTNLIRIALELANEKEAIAIVNAVVQAYLAQTRDYSRLVNRAQTDSYEEQLDKIAKKIQSKRDDLRKLVLKGKVKFNPNDLLNTKNEADQPTFKSLPEDHLQRMISDVYQTDIELFEARALRDAKLAANQASQEAHEQQGPESDKSLMARIQEEFQKDPDVLKLAGEVEQIQDHLEHNKSIVRQPNDPSTKAAAKRLVKLSQKYEDLWASKYKEIRQRLRVAAGTTHSPASIEDLKLKIHLLEVRKERQTTLLKEMEFKQKGVNEDTFEYTSVNYELGNLLHWQGQVRNNLEQLKYEAAHERYRVRRIEEASAAKAPRLSNTWRPRRWGSCSRCWDCFFCWRSGLNASPIPMRCRPAFAPRFMPCPPCPTSGRCAG